MQVIRSSTQLQCLSAATLHPECRYTCGDVMYTGSKLLDMQVPCVLWKSSSCHFKLPTACMREQCLLSSPAKLVERSYDYGCPGTEVGSRQNSPHGLWLRRMYAKQSCMTHSQASRCDAAEPPFFFSARAVHTWLKQSTCSTHITSNAQHCCISHALFAAHHLIQMFVVPHVS